MATGQQPIVQATTEQDYKKLKELMEFPSEMTFKVAGVNRENLAQDLIAVVQNIYPVIIFQKKNAAAKVLTIPFLSMWWCKISNR